MQTLAVENEFEFTPFPEPPPVSGSPLAPSAAIPTMTVPPPYSPFGIVPRSRHSPVDDPRLRPQAFCHADRATAPLSPPGLEDAVDFQAQIVMEPGRIVLLDDEAPSVGSPAASRPSALSSD